MNDATQHTLRRSILLTSLLLAALPAAGLSAQAVEVEEATAPVVKASDLRDLGFHLARQGKFDESLLAFRKAADRDEDDATSRTALRLLTGFLANRAEHEAQRNKEYKQAVQRVWRSLKAMEYRPILVEKELAEPLRKHIIEEVGNAQAGGTTAARLERVDLQKLAQVKADTVKALSEARESLKEAQKLLTEDTSDFAREFRQLSERYLEISDSYIRAWKKVQAESREDLVAEARDLAETESRLSEVLGDLESLVSEDAWRIALAQAQLAKMIVPEGITARDESWYRTVIAKAKELGAEARKDARWYDALAAFAGLKELDPDRQEYKDLEKNARLHVRMLRLYGIEEDTAEEDKDKWREYASGIDAGMVRDTIEQIGRAYVKPVDYRELIEGALDSVKVLAETPQVAEAFEGLADEAKRRQFLSQVDDLYGHYARKANPSSLDLKLALNSVLSKSDQTVRLPTAVIAREFAAGALGELDRFSSMIWPNEYEDFRKSIMGRFGGVGIQISKEPGQPLRVVTPLPGSPAIDAGVKAGDLIVEVEGKDTKDHDIDKLVKMISGPKGTKVTITIKRPGVLKPFDVTIVRDEITIRTVKGWRRENAAGDWAYDLSTAEKVGYIRVEQFTSETHGDLVGAMKELQSQGIHDLVLDLRFNPGGLLNSAEQVSNEFLGRGKIVTTKGRQQAADVRRANRGGQWIEGNVVVLVNDVSASAAEIVSGAMKDWKRALIVGKRTFGKGSVQNVIPIRFNKAMLKLTTAYYYLPTGRLLHRQNGQKDWGVAPDVPVDMTPMQTRDWLDIRSKTDVIAESTEKLGQQLANQYEADIQLQTAVLLLKLQRLRNDPTDVTAVIRDDGEDK